MAEIRVGLLSSYRIRIAIVANIFVIAVLLKKHAYPKRSTIGLGSPLGIIFIVTCNIPEQTKPTKTIALSIVIEVIFIISIKVPENSYAKDAYALTADGQILWGVPLQAPVLALDAGDVDGDARDEVVVGTWGTGGSAGGQVHLLDSGRRLWSVPAGQFVTGVAITGGRLSRTSEASEVLIVAGVGLASGGAILCFDGDGDVTWRRSFGERVTAVGEDGESVPLLSRVLRFAEVELVALEEDLAVIRPTENAAATIRPGDLIVQSDLFPASTGMPLWVEQIDNPTERRDSIDFPESVFDDWREGPSGTSSLVPAARATGPQREATP